MSKATTTYNLLTFVFEGDNADAAVKQFDDSTDYLDRLSPAPGFDFREAIERRAREAAEQNGCTLEIRP